LHASGALDDSDLQEPLVYKVPDSREGWVESLKLLIDYYLVPGSRRVIFDYSGIRPAGTPLKTFGGTSAGSGPLREMHEELEKVFQNNYGKPFGCRAINDISCIIAKAVVSGNIRRSSTIS